MQTIVEVLIACLFAYALFGKRKADSLTILLLSTAFYFLPAAFGFSIYPLNGNGFTFKPIDDDTYRVMIYVSVVVLGGVMLNDIFPAKASLRDFELPEFPFMVEISTALGIAGLVLTLASAGPSVFSAEKSEVLLELNAFFKLWSLGSGMGMVLAYAHRRRSLLIVNSLSVLLTLGLGFRYLAVNTLLALFVMYWHERKPVRLALRYKGSVSILLVFGAAMLFFKDLSGRVKSDGLSAILSLLDPASLLASIIHAEPFTTTCVLNEVVTRNFQVNGGYLFANVFQIVPSSQSAGSTFSGFDFQSALFPQVRFGMGSSYWAEAWAISGVLGLLIFAFILIAFLRFLSATLEAKDPFVRALAAYMGAYLAFYVHRNQLSYLITIEKNLLFFFLGLALMSRILGVLARRSTSDGLEPESA